MSFADDFDRKCYELVRVQGVSYRDAAKRLDDTLQRVRSAVTRESVRRARELIGLEPTPAAPNDDTTAGDAAFLAAMLGDRAPKSPVSDRLHVEDDALGDLPIDADVETIIRHQIKRVTRSINELNARGADAEAQRYTRVLSQLAHELRQHDKAKRDEAGVLHYTLDDVAKAEAELVKMARDVAERPFVCAECGRTMRRAEAEGETP